MRGTVRVLVEIKQMYVFMVVTIRANQFLFSKSTEVVKVFGLVRLKGDETDIELRMRATAPNGLLLWVGDWSAGRDQRSINASCARILGINFDTSNFSTLFNSW